MQYIPLQPVADQTFTCILNNQNCKLHVYERRYGMFVDLYVDNVLVIGGVVAQNLNRIVRSLYLGFVGDLTFADSQGSDDPTHAQLGSRFQLWYLTPADLTSMGFVA